MSSPKPRQHPAPRPRGRGFGANVPGDGRHYALRRGQRDVQELHEVQRGARQHVLRGAEVVALKLGQGLHVQAGDARQRAMLRGHREEARRPARTRRAGRDTRAARLNSRTADVEICFCCCFLSPVATIVSWSRIFREPDARRVPSWAPTDWCAAERGAAERLGCPRNRGGGAERRAYSVKRRRATRGRGRRDRSEQLGTGGALTDR